MRTWKSRLLVVALAAALAVPAAAAPGFGEAGAWWAWANGVWAWATGHPAPAQKVGPCTDPAGRPVPCPKAGVPLGQDDEPAPRAWRSRAQKVGPCIDPDGRPAPCKP